jgi:hypothetical protein
MWRSTLAINAKAEANMHSSLKINLEGAALTGASNGAGRGPSYVAFKIPFASLEVAWGTGGHINVDATLRRAFLVGRRGRDGASGGRDPDPRRSTKNVLD